MRIWNNVTESHLHFQRRYLYTSFRSILHNANHWPNWPRPTYSGPQNNCIMYRELTGRMTWVWVRVCVGVCVGLRGLWVCVCVKWVPLEGKWSKWADFFSRHRSMPSGFGSMSSGLE